MMSSSASSPSEGEIIESDRDKATTSLAENQNHHVNRPSRKRSSISRSPSPLRSPRRRTSRSTSRSPYRESRGSKRALKDDHYDRTRHDSRNFKARYEDRRPGSTAGLGYGSRDREFFHDGAKVASSNRRDGNVRPRENRRHDDRYNPNSQYQKTRYSDDVAKIHWRRHDGPVDKGKDDLVNSRSVSHRARAADDVSNASPSTEHKDAVLQDAVHTPDNSNSLESRYVLHLHFTANAHVPYSRNFVSSSTSYGGFDPTEQAPVDEATLIEERRKRREAIKAKFKGQVDSPLAQTASVDDESRQPTPKPHLSELNFQNESKRSNYLCSLLADQPDDTPRVQSVGNSPREPSVQDSPNEFWVAKDSDLVHENTVTDDDVVGEEPSAADYDPTADMQEDKLRHDQKENKAELSVTALDDSADADQNKDVQVPSKQRQREADSRRAGELDMFGDDDELDMFGEALMVAEKPEKNAGQLESIPQAKALDMSMLDDCDDSDGYYKVILGELLDGRYSVQSNLGKGMFSGVVRATDSKNKKLVAIKVIRSNETMKKAGLKEVEILQKLAHADPEDKKHMVRLERVFEHKGHLCMVFENLSIDLREVLKKFGRDVGINLKAVREYARQMFLGLSLLRKCNVLHADLKPDNVLVNESRTTLKICDLGSASDASENEITRYLVSRFYRAPEIILGLPYDFAIDMWSIGCTLFELYTGKILFTGRSNNQMLRAIMECRGKFSSKLLRKAEFAGLHFDDSLNFRSVEKDRITGKDVVRSLNFTKPTRDLKTRLLASVKGVSDTEIRELNLFVDLLDRCLNINPEKRCTPTEALKHPFIMRAKG